MVWPSAWASTSLVLLLMQYVPGSALFLRHESENATKHSKAWPWTKDTHGHDEDARHIYDSEYRPSKVKHQPARGDRVAAREEELAAHKAHQARPRARVETAATPPKRAAEVATDRSEHAAPIEKVTTRRSGGTDAFGSHVAREPAVLRAAARPLGRPKEFGTVTRNAPQVAEPPQAKAMEKTESIPKPLKSAPVENVTSNRSNGTDSFGSHVAHETTVVETLSNSTKALKSAPVENVTSNRSNGTDAFGSHVAHQPTATATETLANSTKAFGTETRSASKLIPKHLDSAPVETVTEPPSPKAVEEAAFSPNPWDAKSAQSVLAGRRPRVHFLFLAVDKISNMKVWKTFFQDAPKSDFRAYVHCKTYACDASVERSFSALKTIPSVHSEYCTDLVSPMIQLLSHAIDADKDGTHPFDKFVFVSDSTLPAKSFHQIYNTLSERDGSDFCIFPAGEWADRMPAADGQLELLPKHHQWVTLERAHAEKVVRLWHDDHMEGLMSKFRMNWHSYRWNNNSYGDQRNFGCLDEFWFMGAIYGTIKIREYSTKGVWLHDFTNGPLRVDSDAAWQGTCDTFVNWEKHLHAGYRNPFEAFHNELDHFSTPHSGDSARPGWWDRMSPTGLRAIKASDFLFVRKFIDEPELKYGHGGQTFAEAYIDLVLE